MRVGTLDEPVKSEHDELGKGREETLQITYFSLSIEYSSSPGGRSSGFNSIPHSRITLRYFPANKILCFHPSRSGGIHAPPGRRPLGLSGGTPACERFDDADVEPSRNYLVYQKSDKGGDRCLSYGISSLPVLISVIHLQDPPIDEFALLH